MTDIVEPSVVTFVHTEKEMQQELNATIERCAQVVNDWLIRFQKDFAQDEQLTCSNIASRIANLAASIRALKDKP